MDVENMNTSNENFEDKDSQNHFIKGNYIGPYEIREQVGEGGMAKVYKAYYQQLERFVAIKVMDTQVSSKEEYQRFISEAKTTAKLQHPNIVTIYDAGAYMGMNYIVMDFIEGVSLANYIENSSSKLPIEQICNIIKQIAEALHFAHNQGIIHRDIKPSNVMLTKQGRPIVMDFGLAKNIKGSQDVTKTGMIIGTPKYMAPEQIKGNNKSISRSTDVYGLGTVFYEMLTGHSVVTGETPLSISYNILNKAPIPPRTFRPEIPHDVQSICLKALEKTKQKRYRSTNVMAEDIERFLNGEAVFAKQESKLYVIRKGTFRYRLYILISLLVLMTILLLYQNISWLKQKESYETTIASQQQKYETLHLVFEENDKILLAMQELILQNNNQSIKVLEEIIAKSSENHLAYYHLSYLYFISQNYKKAIEYINEAIRVAPDFLQAYALRGNLLIYTQSHEQGIADLKKYLGQYKNISMSLLLAQAYIQKERYNLALEEFQKVVTEERQNLNALNGAAKCFFFLKQYSSSISIAIGTVRIYPNHPEAYYILGYSYHGSNDWEKCILAFDKAQSLDPNMQLNNFWFPYFFFRANAYKKLGNIEKSLRDYTASVEILERWNNKGEAYIQTLIERAEIYRSKNMHKNAVADYIVLQSFAPQRAEPFIDYINTHK